MLSICSHRAQPCPFEEVNAQMDEPHLDTPRLRLRLMEATDLDDLLKIFGDPKVMASL